MKISLHYDERKKGVAYIIVDGDRWREVATSVFGKKPDLPKECSSFEELEEKFQALEYRCAMRYALTLLSKAMNPTKKLIQKLKTKGVSSSTAERVIERCQKNRYLDDMAWAEATVRNEMRKGNGPRRIIMKLITNGIEKSLAEDVIEKEFSGATETIQRLIATKYKSRDLSSYEGRGAVIAALMRKGFDLTDIEGALR